MTVLAQRTYINGPHTLKAVNSLSSASPEPNIATATTIGCMEDGFELSWQFATEDFMAQCTGQTVMDGVYEGVQKATLSAVLAEYDTNRTIIEQLIWPHGNFGELTDVGKMIVYGSDGTPGDNCTILIAEPVAGTAAATNTLRWMFYATYPDPDETFSINFSNKQQLVPVTFRCYPVIVEDAYTAGTNGNRIYYPDDDTSGLTLADHTYRFWRRFPAA